MLITLARDNWKLDYSDGDFVDVSLNKGVDYDENELILRLIGFIISGYSYKRNELESIIIFLDKDSPLMFYNSQAGVYGKLESSGTIDFYMNSGQFQVNNQRIRFHFPNLSHVLKIDINYLIKFFSRHAVK